MLFPAAIASVNSEALTINFHEEEIMNTTSKEPKTDIYTTMTQKIITSLENDMIPWHQPWMSSMDVMKPLRANHQPYSGVNILFLWIAACEKGYTSNHWLTMKQANSLNAKVRKGEKATQIVYADKFDKEVVNDKGETEIQKIPFLKSYWVFNADQIEGLPTAYYVPELHRHLNPDIRDEKLDAFIDKTKAQIEEGNEACYRRVSDKIEMPPFENFENAMSYYGVLSHELTHWTGHKLRLGREFGKYGDETYAKEELVAEIASCFLGAELGFEPAFREDHVPYIQSWLKVLKNDKKFIFQAAAQAQKACEYLQQLQLN